MSDAICTVCDSAPVVALGRCRLCWTYHHRHGVERPEQTILDYIRRKEDDAVLKQWLRDSKCLTRTTHV